MTERRIRTAEEARPSAMWLPLFSEWQERLPLLVAMRDGLASAGIEVRVDDVGVDPFALSMLRVRCPGVSIEAAEHWLLRAVTPSSDAGVDWAGGVVCLLHQRWREYGLWSGTHEEADVLTHRLKALPRGADAFFAGARFTIVHHRARRALLAYARTATELVRALPGVEIVGLHPGGDPREWVAIDVAHDVTAVVALRALEAGLRQLGFATCRYESSKEAFALLTVHAGTATVEEVEERLLAKLGQPWPAWATRYRPWSWEEGIFVHRHPAPEGWRLREWLELELAIPAVGATEFPSSGEVVLKVPVSHVDRALDVLARRPGGLRGAAET